MTKRLHYIDIFKGICLILVVMHHAPLALNGDLAPQGSLYWYINNFITAFFMPAFFVATGYSSSFTRPFKDFLWKNVKTILIPCYCLYYLNRYLQNLNVFLFGEDASWLTWSHWLAPGFRTFVEEGGFYWFLSSLFISKLLMYVLYKFPYQWQKITSAIVLMLVGVLLYDRLPNYFFYQHALILLPFLTFGKLLKKYEAVIEKYVYSFVSVFVVGVVLLSLLGYDVPTVTRNITIQWATLPLFLLLSIAGTVTFWHLSKIIQHSSWLEYIGRGSLVEYCFNYSTLCIVAHLFQLWVNMGGQGTMANAWSCLVISAIATVILTGFYWLLNHKYINVLLGKF